jgi:drug/metabolite transporter (DMT)-like permease
VDTILTQGRRWLTIGAGFALVIAGVFMLVLPGPGIAAIILGLALLAREFRWARRLLERAREVAARQAASARERLSRFSSKRGQP